MGNKPRRKRKVNSMPTVAQAQAEIRKSMRTQLGILRVHETGLVGQLDEVRSSITVCETIVAPTKTKTRKTATKSKAKTSTKSKAKAKVEAKTSSKSKLTLPVALAKSMRKGKKCKMDEIKAGLAKVGYVSVAKNFGIIVHQSLQKMITAGLITKHDRGVYSYNGVVAPVESKPKEIVAAETAVS